MTYGRLTFPSASFLILPSSISRWFFVSKALHSRADSVSLSSGQIFSHRKEDGDYSIVKVKKLSLYWLRNVGRSVCSICLNTHTLKHGVSNNSMEKVSIGKVKHSCAWWHTDYVKMCSFCRFLFPYSKTSKELSALQWMVAGFGSEFLQNSSKYNNLPLMTKMVHSSSADWVQRIFKCLSCIALHTNRTFGGSIISAC